MQGEAGLVKCGVLRRRPLPAKDYNDIMLRRAHRPMAESRCKATAWGRDLLQLCRFFGNRIALNTYVFGSRLAEGGAVDAIAKLFDSGLLLRDLRCRIGRESSGTCRGVHRPSIAPANRPPEKYAAVSRQ